MYASPSPDFFAANWSCDASNLAINVSSPDPAFSLDATLDGVGDASVSCDAVLCNATLFGVLDSFRRKADDDRFDLRVLLDPVATESFAAGGRVAATSPRSGTAAPAGLALAWSGAAAAEVVVYSLRSVYR